jgi:cellulose synthase/poly-beta-1,6-N-acetylglucosamine synthase-like glycosyltransferase
VIATLARLFSRREPFDPQYEPTVTACVPVYNGADALNAKLASLLEQDYPARKLDVLVYSDGSTDGGDALAREWAAREPRVQVLGGPVRAGKPAALNAMAAQARGEVLLLTDVRQPLAPVALRSLVAALAAPEVGCVSGNLILRGGEGAGAYWRYESWIRASEARFRGMVGATGPLYIVRRADFQPLPRDLILDDMWLPMRLRLQGRRLTFRADAYAYDRAFADPREFSRKARTLAGNFQLLRQMPRLLSPFANPSWFETVSHKVLRLVCPFALAAFAVSSLAGAWRGPDRALLATLAGAQGLFYTLALVGRRAGAPGILARTFVVLHLAALVGLWRYLRGRQPITW